MHVLFQLKVPLDLAQGLRERLERVQKEHAAQVALFHRKIKGAPDPTKFTAQGVALDRLGRRLGIQALVREAVKSGCEALAKLDDKALLDRIEKDEVLRGRPVLGGPKRGG